MSWIIFCSHDPHGANITFIHHGDSRYFETNPKRRDDEKFEDKALARDNRFHDFYIIFERV